MRWDAVSRTNSFFISISFELTTQPSARLAWAEMYLLVAALVRRFDLTIEGATASDFELERDNFAIGTKAGCNLMARVTSRVD